MSFFFVQNLEKTCFKKWKKSDRDFLCILDKPSSLGTCNLTLIHHTFSRAEFAPVEVTEEGFFFYGSFRRRNERGRKHI